MFKEQDYKPVRFFLLEKQTFCNYSHEIENQIDPGMEAGAL